MYSLAEQTGAKRIIVGVRIPYPCGDPALSEEADKAQRRAIVETALEALQTDVDRPTFFTPKGLSVS